MINAPNTMSTKDKKLRKQKSASSQESERHHPFHEILNELTVINLCCGKFRVVAEQSHHPSLLVDIEGMERAVIEMTSLLEKVSESIESTSAVGASAVPQRSEPSAAQAQTGNVYPLFKPTERHRSKSNNRQKRPLISAS